MSESTELVQLLRESFRGNQDAFEQLYKKSSPRLFAIALRLLKDRTQAEEVLQEAFVQIWHNASEYHSERGDVLAWMTTIVRYRALDHLRLKKREAVINEDTDWELYDIESSYGRQSTQEIALVGCMSELNMDQRNSISLAFFEGLTHEELAGRLSKPLGTVKAWVRRGIQSLKKCLER